MKNKTVSAENLIVFEDKNLQTLQWQLSNMVYEYTSMLIFTSEEAKNNVHGVIVTDVTKAIIKAAMSVTGGNQSQSSKALGLSRKTVKSYLMELFGKTNVGFPDFHDDE